MPIPTPPSVSPLWNAVFGGGGAIGFLVLIREAVVWWDKRRKDGTDALRKEAAEVEVARIKQRGEDEKEGREEAKRLLAERKEQVAELKADHQTLRKEFGEEIAALKKAQAEESEQRQLVKLAADAAHIRADDAVVQLDAAKRAREDLARKLEAVEARAASAERHAKTLEREKNVEIEILRRRLAEADAKIETLERYIREHKMTVSLTQDGQTITASMEPRAPEPTPAEPPTRDTDY